MIRVGVAGWSVSRFLAHRFPPDGSHLERYARTFPCVEINSSFYRHHSQATYARWAAATPPRFMFAVKLFQVVTHELALRGTRQLVRQFLDETAGLGRKRGPVLVQLPPSLIFESRVAGRFFEMVRERYEGPLVCEPRHASWFAPAASTMLTRHQIARVAADPACAPGGDQPAGWAGLSYFRLHGSPRMYWSRYDMAYIETLARTLDAAPTDRETWCIFDNTALGAAVENAWELLSVLRPTPAAVPVASS